MDNVLTIVTGASRGLGLAVAQHLLARGERVLTLARGTPPLPPSALHEHWSVDLAESIALAARLEQWLQPHRSTPVASLINNAGVVTEPMPLDGVAAADLMRAVRVSLEAPLLLTAAFLRATRGWPGKRKVLLVSSGLGRRPMAGAAAYCAVKAGLDHLARAVALEEAALGAAGAGIASVAPGVIDTDMQVQLRGADPARFADHGHFVELKTKGKLDSPAQAAAKLVRYLDRADFGSQPVADVRDP